MRVYKDGEPPADFASMPSQPNKKPQEPPRMVQVMICAGCKTRGGTLRKVGDRYYCKTCFTLLGKQHQKTGQR